MDIFWRLSRGVNMRKRMWKRKEGAEKKLKFGSPHLGVVAKEADGIV